MSMSPEQKKSSNNLRRTGAIVLLLGALPMLHSSYKARDNSPAPAAQDAAANEWVVPTEINVQLKPGVSQSDLVGLGKIAGSALQFDGSYGSSETEFAFGLLPAAAAQNTAQILAALRNAPGVEAADVTHIYRIPAGELLAASAAAAPGTPPAPPASSRWKPNDPRYGEQWNFQMVDAEGAWQQTHGKGAVVAVIDTGVAYKDTKSGKQARDFDRTQFVPGYDFVHRNAIPYDDNGHGTHVAGTIAESTDNGEGVAGLAYEARIMPLKVLSAEGSGSSRNIAEAIRWAADHGANIINMSLGSPFPDSLIGSACRYAYDRGVTIVCAAGNSGREGVGYPAAFKECIAVSSVGPTGDLSFFSSWGKQVAIAAPGGDKNIGGDSGGILQSTVLPDSGGTLVDGYYTFQGTSMASPHVAATAALIYSQGLRKPDDIKTVLQKSAVTKADARKYGAGVLNAANATALAGREYGDSVARFWIAASLFLFAGLLARAGKAGGAYAGISPFWGAAAGSIGLLLPDWVANYAGSSSLWNMAGHSVLVPAALLVMGARSSERRLLGWMSAGLMAHLTWSVVRGTVPFGPEIGASALIPWTFSNLLVGFGLVVSALAAPRDKS
jgi:serine protease